MGAISRRLAVVAVLVGVVAALVTAAWGYLTTTGSAAASAPVGTLGTPTLSASAESPGAGQITLNWTAVNAPAGVGTVRYYVARSTGTAGGTCPSTAATATTALTCHDDSLNAGSYTYQVVAVWQSWSATSNTAQTTLPYGPADHFSVSAPASTTAGTAVGISVTAKDASQNTVTDYSGTVHFTSSDSKASLPLDYSFTSTDAGSHTFASAVTLDTAGSQSVTATDVSQHSVTGSASISVSPAAATRLVFTSSAASGAASSTPNLGPIRLEEQDQYGNASTTPMTVSLSSSSASGVFSTAQDGSSATTVSLGGSSSSATLYYGDKQAGTPTITAAASSITSATQKETVNPGNAVQLVFTSQPVSGAASQQASLGPITVQEQDQFGNPSTSVLTVNLSSTSGTGVFATAQNGSAMSSISIGGSSSSGSFYYGDTKADTPTLTAAASGITSSTQKELISPATPTTIGIVSGSPQSVSVGTPFASPLIALVTDNYGNPVPGVSVTFTAPPTGASATFTSNGCTSNSPLTTCTVATDSSGDATSSSLTANGSSGSYNIAAAGSGTNSVNFTMTNTGSSTVAFTTTGLHTLTVPAGVTTVKFTLTGAGGGGGYAGALGGAGGSVQGTMTLPANSSATSLTVMVGAGGGAAQGGGPGGAGFGNGGHGGDPTQDGGGGGGGTAVYIVSSSPIAVAGGGGGGGGNGQDAAAGSGGTGTGGLVQNPGTSTAGTGGSDGSTAGGLGGAVRTSGSASPFSYSLTLGGGGSAASGGAAGSPASTSGGTCTGGTGGSSSNNGNAGGGGGGGGGLACGGGGAAGPTGVSGAGGGGAAGYSGGSVGSNVDITVTQVSTGSSGGNSMNSGVDGSASFTGSGIAGS